VTERSQAVRRVIGVEEHAWTPELRDALLRYGEDDTVNQMSGQGLIDRRLLDVGEERLARMDAAGVDMQVLSITTPGTQPLPPEAAVPLARDANDFLADAVRRHPGRFSAFATLPTSDPAAAAAELERSVTKPGLVGALLFPRTGEAFLDHDSFRPVFEAAAQLGVPLYLHPAFPPRSVRAAAYSGFDEWTSMILARRLGMARRSGARRAPAHPGRHLRPPPRPPGRSRPLGRDARAVRGPGRPAQRQHAFGAGGGTRAFVETAPVSAADKAKLAHLNAERLLGLHAG
jgi:predicted TIM-barrel fold metal-dependent hydrolase